MKYQFEIESISIKKGKIEREERNDIVKYLSDIRIEAENERNALKQLVSRINGCINEIMKENLAIILLPDYENCRLVLRAVAVT